jgi:uncharacterized protein (TIGR02231 family)
MPKCFLITIDILMYNMELNEMSSDKHTKLETTIDKVVVFLDGARIYRSGKTNLKKGLQKVRIVGLTKKLRKDSVRVSGKGKGSLGSIDVESVYHEEITHDELNKLVQEEKALQKQKSALQEKLQFLQHQQEQMKTLSNKFSSEFPLWFASGEAKLTTLTEFLDFESQKNSDNLKERRELNDEIEKLNKKIAIVQAQINDYRNKSHVEQTFDVAITVDVKETGSFRFDLSYQTVGVSWEPSYDVDLQEDKATLKGMAQIRNNTLEDWQDIELEISTAVFKPVTITDPRPFYIDIYEPRSPSGGAIGGRMMAKKARPPPTPAAAAPREKEEMLDEAKPMKALYEPEATMKESPAGVQSYELPGKWTIPSDGNEHPVTLTTQELETKKLHYWSAVDALGVIAQDEIQNDDSIILAGQAKVYSEGEFIGETFIEQISPREDFKLGTREELKMKAEKKLLEREKSKAGLVKGKRSISYEYELIIKNFLKKEAPITIKDVIPYSRSERIKVKNFEATIEPKEENLGIYTWELTIAPGKETKIKYQYEVEWEKNYRITPSLP